MPRVFHIISHFDMGGAERVAAHLAMAPGVEGHVVEIMRGRSSFTQGFIDELTAAGVHVHRAWMPDIMWHFVVERLTALLFPLRFLFTYLRWRPEVIHAHTEGPDMCVTWFFTLFPWLRRRVRIVRTIHNTRLWTGQRRIGLRVERFYRRHATNVAISQSVLRAYGAWGEADAVICNGVPEVEQLPYPHLVHGKINVVFSGRFEEQKGIDTLMEVIERVAKMERHNHWVLTVNVGFDESTRQTTGTTTTRIEQAEGCPYHFHLFGDGSLRAQIVARLGGLPCVSIHPPLGGLARQLGSFSYLFMPSRFEGLSIVALEASMAGLPNIINDAPGLGETLPPDWPLKVRDNSVDDFVHLFTEVIPTADRYLLSRQAHDYASRHFSLEAMRRGYARVYQP